MKTVSIIIPVYNAAEYVEKCVNSLMCQTYKDIEIILVNDASTDGSDVICERLSLSNDKIKYISNEKNSGQTITRNKGVDAATGNWMLFLDADDYLEQDALSFLVAASEKNDSDIVISDYKTITDKGNETGYSSNLKEKKYSTKELLGLLFSDVSLEFLSCIGTKLYKTRFVKERKPITPNSVRTNYDLAFILDALVASPSISYVKRISYVYFIRTGSITHNYRKDMYKNLTETRFKLLPLLKDNGCYEEKKINFHSSIFYIILSSLVQEIQYSKGFAHYKELFTFILNDPKATETLDIIRNNGNNRSTRFYSTLIKGRHYYIFYVIYKMRKIIKEYFKK